MIAISMALSGNVFELYLDDFRKDTDLALPLQTHARLSQLVADSTTTYPRRLTHVDCDLQGTFARKPKRGQKEETNVPADERLLHL
jgi:hypothetical protein